MPVFFPPRPKKISYKDVTIAGEELQNLSPIIVSALMTEILNFYNVLSLFRSLIPLENGVALHLPIIQGRIMQSLVEICTMVLEKKHLREPSVRFARSHLPLGGFSRVF